MASDHMMKAGKNTDERSIGKKYLNTCFICILVQYLIYFNGYLQALAKLFFQILGREILKSEGERVGEGRRDGIK